MERDVSHPGFDECLYNFVLYPHVSVCFPDTCYASSFTPGISGGSFLLYGKNKAFLLSRIKNGPLTRILMSLVNQIWVGSVATMTIPSVKSSSIFLITFEILEGGNFIERLIGPIVSKSISSTRLWLRRDWIISLGLGILLVMLRDNWNTAVVMTFSSKKSIVQWLF